MRGPRLMPVATPDFDELEWLSKFGLPHALDGVVHAVALRLPIRCRAYREELRARLTRLVGQFRARLRETRVVPIAGLFPVQMPPPISGIDVLTMHERLRGAGISAVLYRHPKRRVPRISFLITAAHNLDEVDRPADAVREIVARVKST